MQDMAFSPPDPADLRRQDQDDEEDDQNSTGLVDEPDVEAPPEDQDELVSQATDVVEGVVLRVAGKIINELRASYETCVYSDVFFIGMLTAIDELKMNLHIERNVVMPIYFSGRACGSLKAPFVVSLSSGKPLLALEVKTKRTALKESDMDNIRCVVEQMGIQSSTKRRYTPDTFPSEHDIPRAMLLNFSGGTQTSMILHSDGTVSN
jgi:hypothetical protein